MNNQIPAASIERSAACCREFSSIVIIVFFFFKKKKYLLDQNNVALADPELVVVVAKVHGRKYHSQKIH